VGTSRKWGEVPDARLMLARKEADVRPHHRRQVTGLSALSMRDCETGRVILGLGVNGVNYDISELPESEHLTVVSD